MDELEMLAPRLEKLPRDAHARLQYDLYAGALVWSDETPDWVFEGPAIGESPAGLGVYRALLNYRSSLILGQPNERYRHYWERALRLCPGWPGFLPERQDPSLADECRKRAEAGLRSFEELDARFEQQRQAKAKKASA
jgi:hypothetical protein